jgi:hypothetical protein
MNKNRALLAAAATLALTSLAVPSIADARENTWLHHHRNLHGAYGYAPESRGFVPGYYGAVPGYGGGRSLNRYEGEGGTLNSNLNPDFQLGGRF